MENNISKAVFIFNDTEGITEFKVPAQGIEERNGWIVAFWENQMTGGVKAEHLKAFYFEAKDIDINKSECQSLINENLLLKNENKRLKERVNELQTDLINETNKNLDSLVLHNMNMTK